MTLTHTTHVLTGRPLKGDSKFVSRHLENNDYYSENEEATGHWWGKGAQQIGLSGAVTPEQLNLAGQGLNPVDGSKLRLRFREDGVAFWDFTCSAPKSVSVMSMVDERIPVMHEAAVTRMLEEAEKYARYDRKSNSIGREKVVSGNLIVARYAHTCSRALDPQLHDHCLFMNMTMTRDGSARALESREIYKRSMYLTEVYRNDLCRQLLEAGYELDGCEIAGVSKDIRDRFSQRSKQKELAIEKFTKEEGRPPTDNEVSVLVRETRPDKLKEISAAEVKALQKSRLTDQEQRQLEGGEPRGTCQPARAKFGKLVLK